MIKINDINVFFNTIGYQVYPMNHNLLLIEKGTLHMSVEIMIDSNWYGNQYPLRELIIYQNKLQTRSDWLCVLNRDKTEFYILPMCVVLTATKVQTEDKGIMFSVPPSLAQYSYDTEALYFKD